MIFSHNGKKRPSSSTEAPSKRRKIVAGSSKDNVKKNAKSGVKKDKLADRGVIPIPVDDNDEDVNLSDNDMELLNEFGGSVGFLQTLDKKGIMRSKKETQRLHELSKPVRERPHIVDDLPPVESEGEDEDSWSSGVEDLPSSSGEEEHLSSSEDENHDFSDSDEEMPYEQQPRTTQSKKAKEKEVARLPIKLADGKILKSGIRTVAASDAEASEEESEDEPQYPPRPPLQDGSRGARFGRPAIATVLRTSSRKAKVQLAKEQIAGICSDILADPENSLILLKRLHSFALPEIKVDGESESVPNDEIVRKLAMLSQLAVFKDIIPGYRIRALTDAERSEKVSQIVARTREWEQGLVSVYQNYLRLLDGEIKGRTTLADAAIACMCALLTEVTHFNFRQNLMSAIVTRLSKRSWDETSDRCLNTLNTVFRADHTGEASLEALRLLNRMVKERKFRIHPNVLSCLLNLRLRTELNVRASLTTADRAESDKKKKQKKKDKPYLSKKSKKDLKERKEIEKELREAEAEVDKEERATRHTETLKLLFVLYFRILKHPTPSPLLPAALTGISKFAHLVNIDFFKDLLKVLKDLMVLDSTDSEPSEAASGSLGDEKRICHRLLCISTAFELLSGQGEALNIDLSDFITELYAMLLPLSLLPGIDAPYPGLSAPNGRPNSADQSRSIADLCFNALQVIFSPRSSGTGGLGNPTWRAAAFSKRLLIASLHWPPSVALQAISFVKSLIVKHPKLEALLTTEDRTHNGVYRADVDDPQLCHALESSLYELHLLQKVKANPRVGEEARRILDYTS
ncbi:nucleolar complex-associated protein 3 [Coprinopsis marcescibilis]|uniref:Nucleolar complex-associated protein 3 n=1 Tax=Coprinopsis marcescibilis TaxID=230819 RepID=A0A5C3LAP1_COPMA|nr:nucleolar complex-associated protein 3 [Coprinopsis marcescibilis]